jgi:hypothetical protein
MNTSPLVFVHHNNHLCPYLSLFMKSFFRIGVSSRSYWSSFQFSFASQYVMGESSTNLSYWLRSAFAVNLVAVYLPTSLV